MAEPKLALGIYPPLARELNCILCQANRVTLSGSGSFARKTVRALLRNPSIRHELRRPPSSPGLAFRWQRGGKRPDGGRKFPRLVRVN